MDKIKYCVNITSPEDFISLLSQDEIEKIRKTNNPELFKVFKACSLAVLAGDDSGDEADFLEKTYHDFDIDIVQVNRGVKIKLYNSPQSAFVDGKMIEGIKRNLFSVLRDILYVYTEIENNSLSFRSSKDITNSVFKILRKSNVMIPRKKPNLIVCWGGHSIDKIEYLHTKEVGYQLGLRDFDICTGCGLGAMKGPMKGATIGHAKIRSEEPRYIGISEPGIISSESPNPIVNNLIIMPDIEKRLEAFVRLAHGIIIFPGGAGTCEELLYLLGIKLNPKNKDIKLPIILSAPKEKREYIEKVNDFIRLTLGEEATKLYDIIYDPVEVGKKMSENIESVTENRIIKEEAFYYNWDLNIEAGFQEPFIPTHENILNLNISKDLDKHELAVNLRRLFSSIVAGNIKPDGIKAVKEKGPFLLKCDDIFVKSLDELLNYFVKNNRMKLPSEKEYIPCYKILK